jgi:glutaminyl-tRNA synthetase
MCVLVPLKVRITNLKSVLAQEQWNLKVPNFPADESRGFHNIPLREEIWIEESDFRNVVVAQAEKGYKRWALDQAVGLRHAGIVLSVKSVEKVSLFYCSKNITIY